MPPPDKSKKNHLGAFTSIRIIGEKAHRLLQAAQRTAPESRTRTPLPEPEEHAEFVVHLSLRSVVRMTFAILAIAAGAWLIFHLRDKILLLVLAVFLAAVIDPSVQWMQQRLHIPRGLAILAHYFVALFFIVFLLVSLIPIVADQLQQIALFIESELDAFLADPQVVIPFLSMETNFRLTLLAQDVLRNLSITEFADALQQFGQNLSTAAHGSLRFAAQLAGSVVAFMVNFIVVLVLSFFIQIEKEGILHWARSLFPRRLRTYLDNKSEAVHTKIGQWVRGQLLLMFSIFCLTLVALIILRMPYALTLAVLAGFCEFIPAIGPFIAAIPAVLIAFSQEGIVWGLVLVGVYYVIQWCENNLLVPLIMKRAVGLSPIAILFAMMVGVSFPDTIHPILGVMLAVPTTTILTIFLEDIRDRRE